MERSDVEELISRRLCGIETAIPAKVKAVASDGTLSVEALIKKVSVDGIVDVQNLLIDGVKPFVVGNEFAYVDLGIDAGAQVMLVGISRHASEWLGSDSDDAMIPKSPLGLSLNDLVAVPLFRGDREAGKSSRISLGADGKVEIASKYGQSIVFNKDGSIEMSPKSGKTIKMKSDLEVEGDVKGTDFKTPLLSFNDHAHPVLAVPNPGGTPVTSTGPVPVPVP